MSALVNKIKEVIHHEPSATGSGGHLTSLGDRLDPAVDTGAEGFNAAGHDTAGEHDPRVDSGPDRRVSHDARHTTGPHKSELLNKLDPRAHSVQISSNTVSENRTSSM
ncbi:hypothetical protein GP486_007702 [Trichoglossum hirsutum]|uniref:Uncharacterized protein n=1 Tax=Trichoglossum hirsutum TaxID=265104 RepID=A0A9P8L6Q5_9PEZI|nr:hypothetical protein GP486_007702 [Trichoglossum hirsutum]